MLFNIINPHDPYTLEAPDLEIAANAIALIGKGAYGLHELSGDQSGHVPMFPIDGHDEWFTKQFGRDFKASLEHVMATRSDALSKALASVFVGTPADKREFDRDAAACADEAEFHKLLTTRHDALRGSSNDIGRFAWGLADIVAETALAQAPAVKAD